ncbi:YkgJ family cysteine cluster protein [Actibacterium sp. XHP0104]|uniref:YkgJ family cysteine cluster protein n=1 Tax=Actibacterium sp. XHP0104 TaxID=2984335 RepID=UPI0021E85870|nr:YkgJ family cysteine cluster protein [Actibacterium sp. XHP0104]MCV2880838.1 YkgJ family cysteine cluster protein [Actibacterium sp. XHP0104]
MMALTEFDCTQCGACCFGGHDRYIVLLEQDTNRNIPPALTNEIDGRRYMKMQNGHCAQLCAAPGGQLNCGVYDQRPEACRAFRSGSFECTRARMHRMAQADAMRIVAGSGIMPGAEVA